MRKRSNGEPSGDDVERALAELATRRAPTPIERSPELSLRLEQVLNGATESGEYALVNSVIGHTPYSALMTLILTGALTDLQRATLLLEMVRHTMPTANPENGGGGAVAATQVIIHAGPNTGVGNE